MVLKIEIKKCEWLPFVKYAIDLKSGMLVRTVSGNIQLVGDINELAGVCDDCVDEEVVAYSNTYLQLFEEIKKINS